MLSPSGHSWLNYDKKKLINFYENSKKKEEGTYLHDLASRLINKKIKVAKFKKAFNLFVNDAIGFGMESELVLYYSDYCFGTADALAYKGNVLRIHDLKTGDRPVLEFGQLIIYDALFCLEYHIDPNKVKFINRLYQFDGYSEQETDPKLVIQTIEQIRYLDSLLEQIETGGL